LADGDLVRTIKISATGENVDSTRAAVEKLSAATTQLSNQTSESAKAYKAQTDALNSNTSAMGSMWQQIVAGGIILGALKLAWDAVVGVVNAFIDVAGQIIKLAWDAVMFVPNYLAKQWETTTNLLASYVALAGKAGALGISTDFYQSQTKAAENLKITNDSIIKQMEALKTATAEQLGGSTGQNRVDELQGFGNFKGNTGVDQLKDATTQEEKYKAVVSLIDQAVASGERLAAIDVAKTMLGPDAAANLAKDSEYFDKIQSASDKLQTNVLVPDADVSRALDLQNRLQAASDIISKQWFPTQRDGLNPLVMAFKELWVEIVELVAGAFTWVEKLVKSMLSIPSDLWQKFQDWRHGGDTQGPQQETPDQANALRTGLQNPNSVAQAGSQTLAASDVLRRDKSHASAQDAPSTEGWDRATDSLRKYIEVTNAASLSVDAGVNEQEKFKAIAQLTAAGIRDGLTPEAAKLKAEMSGLATQAGNAAEALAKAKIASEIKRGAQTSLLSPEDVQIATQLKGLYPNVADALGSVEAAGLRTNSALSGISSQLSGTLTTGLTDILDGTKSVGQGFSDMSKLIVRAIEEMIVKLLIVGPLMRQLQSSMGSLIPGGVGGVGSNATDGIGGFGPTAPPGYAGGTNSAPGGWSIVGENGPELMNLQPGATILPNGSGGGGGNGGGNNVQVNVVNNADGTKATTSKRTEGNVDIHSIIISAVDSHVAGGGLDKTMKARYATPLRTKGR
jgi:hypothetical protein